MGVGPRIIVVDVLPSRTGTAGAWARVGSAPELVSWRLIGANNRQLGRSVTPLPASVVDEHLRRLGQRCDELVFAASARSPGPLWSWRAELDRSVVAVSTRGFQRHRDATYNAQQFALALRDAVVVRDVERPQAFRDRRRQQATDRS